MAGHRHEAAHRFLVRGPAFGLDADVDTGGMQRHLRRGREYFAVRIAVFHLDQQVAALIAAGESSTVEFKSSVRWDVRENRLNDALKFSVIKTVAAFLNSNGGTLFSSTRDEVLGAIRGRITAPPSDRSGRTRAAGEVCLASITFSGQRQLFLRR